MLRSVAQHQSHVRCGLPLRQPARAALRRFRAPGRTQWGLINARPNASVRSCITTNAMRVTQWWPQRVRFSRGAVACALTEGPAILCRKHIHSQQRFALHASDAPSRKYVCGSVCWVCDHARSRTGCVASSRSSQPPWAGGGVSIYHLKASTNLAPFRPITRETNNASFKMRKGQKSAVYDRMRRSPCVQSRQVCQHQRRLQSNCGG